MSVMGLLSKANVKDDGTKVIGGRRLLLILEGKQQRQQQKTIYHSRWH